MPYGKELEIGTFAVKQASLLTKQHLLTYQSRKSHVSQESKADTSEVTVADFAAQALIISIIHETFPNDDFIAEESSDMLRSNESLASKVYELVSKFDSPIVSKDEMLDIIDLGQRGGEGSSAARTWILDPIDGTKTYIMAQQYAVCLCLVEGEQQVGILGCSNLDLEQRVDGRVVVREDVVDLKPDGGWILSAIRGQGTFMQRIAGGERQSIDSNGRRTGNKDVKLRFTDSSASSHTSKDFHNMVFEYFLPVGEREMSMPAVPEGQPTLAVDLWAMQLKYVILALRGAGADAMIRVPPQSDYHAAVWDHAGGQLLLKESGGILTDALGKKFVVDGKTRQLVHNWGVCAVRGGIYEQDITAGQAHEAVLEKLTVELAKRS